MGIIRDFVVNPLIAPVIDRYRKALVTEGADIGAARGTVEQLFLDQQAEDRKELKDFLDSEAETPGAPHGGDHSYFGLRIGGHGSHD